MQFNLTLLARQPRTRIPFNYPYLVTGWLYRLLASADATYATFLHERGYRTERKTFKLFTFSDLRMSRYEVRPAEGCFELLSPEVNLTLSFYIDQAAEAFVVGLFQAQECVLTNRRHQAELVVNRVQSLALPEPSGNKLRLRTASPLVVAQKDASGMDQYLPPTDARFGPLLLGNLVDKYRSVHPTASVPDASAMNYRLVSKPDRVRSRLLTIKEGSPQETRVRGYYGFEFELSGPWDVLEVGVLAGLGRYNAEGFGCVETLKT